MLNVYKRLINLTSQMLKSKTLKQHHYQNKIQQRFDIVHKCYVQKLHLPDGSTAAFCWLSEVPMNLLKSSWWSVQSS